MPFSQTSQLSAIVGLIEQLNPSSLLDVGAGMGQYGFLARIKLEHVNLFCVNGKDARQRPKEEWRVRIDGIEGYAGYLTPVHGYAYSHMMIGEAGELLRGMAAGSYELVLAIDILEHYHRPEGLAFLDELKRVASRAVLVSTPKEFCVQEVEANPYEDHRSHWSYEDLARRGFTEILHNPESWVVVHRKPLRP
jgi:2-polyprenyl-3-methyl-5-hydroxy-6-metoxy-1,4-benzoquinol methylase